MFSAIRNHMQAIITTFKKTNGTSGNVIATIASGHSAKGNNYDGNTGKAHKKAAKALCDFMDWQGELIGAVTATGWAHIMIPKALQDALDVTAAVADLFPGQDPIRTAAAFVDIKKALAS